MIEIKATDLQSSILSQVCIRLSELEYKMVGSSPLGSIFLCQNHGSGPYFR